MADDPWAAWAPTANPTAKAKEAYQARRALSRGLSADPMSPGAPGSSRHSAPRQAPSGGPMRSLAAVPASSSSRRPLPDQSFPGAGRGAGPSRSGAGWHRSPTRGHIDRGWANQTGHEEPIAKPIAGDIESASNAPLTEGQRRDLQNTRSSRQDLEDRNRSRLVDARRGFSRSNASPRDNKRPRSREREREKQRDRDFERERHRERDRNRGPDRDRNREGESDTVSDRDRDRKRPRRDEDNDARRSRRRSRSRSRSRDRTRREDERDRRRDDERKDRRRDDRDVRRDAPSFSRSERSSNREAPKRIKEESPVDRLQEDAKQPQLEPRSWTPEIARKDDKVKETDTVLNGANTKRKDYSVVVEGIHSGATVDDVKTTLGEFGKVTYCQELQEPDQERGTTSYEIGFTDLDGAVNAVSNMNGQMADAGKLHVSLLNNTGEKKSEETKSEEVAPEPAALEAEPELKLKGFASSSNKDSSLLSRLGAPLKPVTKTNGAGKSNGTTTSKLPSFMQPYDGLLLRAGVDSLDKLKRLVKPGTVKAYIEMLCEEFPEEELLNGLTARWALKERLEEWLDEKAELKMDWDM